MTLYLELGSSDVWTLEQPSAFFIISSAQSSFIIFLSRQTSILLIVSVILMADISSVFELFAGLVDSGWQLRSQAADFVSCLPAARPEMDIVSRELLSNINKLETLGDSSRRTKFPDGLQQTLKAVLKNCDIITKRLALALQEVLADPQKMQDEWKSRGRAEVDQFLGFLTRQESALDIVLRLLGLLSRYES